MGDLSGYSRVATSFFPDVGWFVWASEHNISEKASTTWGTTRSVPTPVSCTTRVIRYLSGPAAMLNNEPRVEIITYVHSLRLLP